MRKEEGEMVESEQEGQRNGKMRRNAKEER